MRSSQGKIIEAIILEDQSLVFAAEYTGLNFTVFVERYEALRDSITFTCSIFQQIAHCLMLTNTIPGSVTTIRLEVPKNEEN